MQFHPGDNSNNRSALLIARQAEGFQWSPLNLQLFFAINISGRTKSEIRRYFSVSSHLTEKLRVYIF